MSKPTAKQIVVRDKFKKAVQQYNAYKKSNPNGKKKIKSVYKGSILNNNFILW